MADSRRDGPATAERQDTGDESSGHPDQRTAYTAAPSSPMRTVSSGTEAADRASNAPNANRAATAAQQAGRVTMVASKPPPLALIETPSRKLNADEFWIAGIWRGESGAYVWQAGRIGQDRPGELYVPARWSLSSRGWEYTPDSWR